MSPGAAAAVTVSSVEAKFPVCVTLSRNPFSGRNAVGRAKRGCWRFVRSVAPKLLASICTLPAGFLAPGTTATIVTVLSLLQLSANHGSTSPTWVLQLFAHVMHEPMRLATLRRASTRVRRWEPTYNGPAAIGRKPLPPKKKTYHGHHDAVNLTTREFALRDDRFVAAKARDSERCPTECLATAHDSELRAK